MQYRLYLYQRRPASTGLADDAGKLYRTDSAGRTLEADVAEGWHVIQIFASNVSSQFWVLLEKRPD